MFTLIVLLAASLPLYSLLRPRDGLAQPSTPEQEDTIDLPYGIEASSNA